MTRAPAIHLMDPNELLVEAVAHLLGVVSILASLVPQVSTHEALLRARYLVQQPRQAVELVQAAQSVIDFEQATHFATSVGEELLR